MMRLMADLISYLRDLLVFKVKPETLSEDVDLELQRSLAAQAELIETDRLLELIDQFAEAEARMKWAPNKKLHFEVALIKAIQSLNQVTLSEVIENLNALRDGKEIAKRPATVVAGVSPASKNTAAGSAVSTVPRVAEESSDANADVAKIWGQVCAKIPAKGFLRTLVDSLTVLGTEGRYFVVGYPAEEKSATETLITANNRRQLEALLKETSGRDWNLKFMAREDLPRKKATAPADEVEDPLIQEALEIFKGRVRS